MTSIIGFAIVVVILLAIIIWKSFVKEKPRTFSLSKEVFYEAVVHNMGAEYQELWTRFQQVKNNRKSIQDSVNSYIELLPKYAGTDAATMLTSLIHAGFDVIEELNIVADSLLTQMELLLKKETA